MANKTYHQIRATMAVCLRDAESMFDGDVTATSEDIRSTAISMAIEMARSGAEPSAKMRFLTKYYENLEILGDAETSLILYTRINGTPIESIVDLREMAYITRAMIKKIEELKAAAAGTDAANSPNANTGDEA